MHYFAQQDPQGSRLLFILTSFRDVVLREQAARDQQSISDQQVQRFAQSQMATASENNDPMVNLFQGTRTFAPENPSAPPVADPVICRHNSNPSISPAQPPTTLRSTASHPNDAIQSANTGPDSITSRHNSLDTFFDLAHVSSYPNSSGSNDGTDSLGDAEIDFEQLWRWPNSNGTGMTPGVGPGMGLTPTANVGIAGAGVGGVIDVQGISDSSVPLFAMITGEFGAS